MTARAYRLLGESELARTREHLRGACAAWASEWLRDGDAPSVACLTAEADEPAWPAVPQWLSASRGAASAHLALMPEVLPAMQRLLFGPAAEAQPSVLGREVAQTALQALIAHCLPGTGATVQPGSAAPPAWEWRRGSGAVAARLRWPGGIELKLMLDAGATGLLAAPAPARPRPAARLSDPRSAIGHGRVELRAWTGAAEIDFATLQSLAPGDVIRLDLRIDEPLRLTIGGVATPRRAYLGGQGGRRALRLTATADALPPKAQEGPHVDPVE